MRAVGMEAIREHDVAPDARSCSQRLAASPACACSRPTCPADKRIALATFVVDAPGMTQENVARALCDLFGVCVSGGLHCTHVLHARAKLDGTVARQPPRLQHRRRHRPRCVEGVREIAAS